MSIQPSFKTVLDKFRKEAYSERDKGNKFERLMQAFLQTHPNYATLFKHVWLWNEFPGRGDFGGKDTGIDLVAQTIEGDFWAIQCKCYQATSIIDKPEVDSFLSTSSREFKDENLKTTRFSHRLWISTTNKWGTNAEETIHNQHPPVSRINLFDLEESPVDWGKLEQGLIGENSRNVQKKLRNHQIEAVTNAHEYFKTFDRGKLIMACGTGKTFTSLKIAEKETDGNGLILFLVPSIALLGQTLREWSAESAKPIKPICICSDSGVSQKQSKKEDSDGFSIVDLALPASTNVSEILKQFKQFRHTEKEGMTVVFSTYQSIEVIARAQQKLLETDPEFACFDLIICDEAHRTTGVTVAGDDSSAFVKVHDNDFIKAKKRIYMTATPRLFSDDSKSKAAQSEAILCSMDDAKLYGEEIYRIGFGAAVERNLLSDYKVLILTLDEGEVPIAVQKMLSGDNEIGTTDISKLIGCINALSKQILGDEGLLKNTDPDPMRRAVAFCQNIKNSKSITKTFNSAKHAYLESLSDEKRENTVTVFSDHVDGTMSAPLRDEKLSWLKNVPENSRDCHILTNVRCLSEGVDVPTLDAVLFLSARNSQVDVVQSVGRVMRKSEGKKYGYIIIPVVVPSDIEPDQALNDNERYKVVWTVLNALRAHDDRFNAMVNKIELNKKKPEQIIIGRPDSFFDDASANIRDDFGNTAAYQTPQATKISEQLLLQFQQLQNVVFARMVQKVGDRRYWEQWAKEVAEIAQRYIERITRLINQDNRHFEAFGSFLDGLQKNINPAITQAEAIEMLAQHIITKPVFEALFESYSFVKNNPISISMQSMIDLLEAETIEKDTEILNKFYESVKMRAAGIDNSQGRQRIIVELYDKFFKTAFPKMVEKLGIVYTPVEVVDFIVHSVNDVLKKEFGRSISDENIHILDPFTGTGTFITRLLQSGLISSEDIDRKFRHELHANEIVLLAYYIAAINIENAYHDLQQSQNYEPFEGICLTDTFQLGESKESEKLFSEMFPQNSDRVLRQKSSPIRIILGNPPYSVGQKSANDNAQNQSYDNLDSRISKTYAAETKAINKNSLYDSYFKAFRWSTDRLDPEHGGIIAFVSNGSWLDGNATEGFRKTIEKEFSSIYVFNLRGNQRTSGELSRREGGKIFGSGSRTPVAITLLIKNPSIKNGKAKIYYHDIGDYLSREEKLKKIVRFGSVGNSKMEWLKLNPNEHGDWISTRNDVFGTFIPLAPETKFDVNSKSIFITSSNGLQTNRDSWIYNFSNKELFMNISQMIEFYNQQVEGYKTALSQNPNLIIENYINTDASKIKWSSSLFQTFERQISLNFQVTSIVKSIYRPFTSEYVYFDNYLNHRTYQIPRLFPRPDLPNLVICVSGVGVTKEFTCLITNLIPDLESVGKTQSFSLYYYEEQNKINRGLFDSDKSEFVRRDGISDFIFNQTREMHGNIVSKEDIFYYVYGILHSKDYREKFSIDLKKMLPRIPLVDSAYDFWAFSKAGRKLADLHINYENVPPSDEVIVHGEDYGFYKVEKMRFPSKTDKSQILFNSKITVSNIPEKAYEYIVNGKSAIEWIMERYQITTHKESGIRNDPNDWAPENPRYILDLLLSIVRISTETVDIVNNLPRINFE